MTISIITPSYGQLDWLRLCVASVADQVAPEAQFESTKVRKYESNDLSTFEPSHLPTNGFAVEHIIQDAGSPGIEEFAREVGAILQQRYGGEAVESLSPFDLLHFRTEFGYTLRILKEPDAGMYDAINKGLARATGEICAWLNSDEQYLKGALPKAASLFGKKSGLDVLLGDALLTDREHLPVCYRRIMVPGRRHTRLDHLHSLSCAMFFRKSSLPSPPLDPRWRVISDAVLMDYFLKTKRRIFACRQLLSTYAFTGANLSANPALREHDAWLSEENWPPSWQRRFVVINSRLRRLASGAYRSFAVDEEIFTRESPWKRVPVQGIVSGRWPKDTGFADGSPS